MRLILCVQVRMDWQWCWMCVIFQQVLETQVLVLGAMKHLLQRMTWKSLNHMLKTWKQRYSMQCYHVQKPYLPSFSGFAVHALFRMCRIIQVWTWVMHGCNSESWAAGRMQAFGQLKWGKKGKVVKVVLLFIVEVFAELKWVTSVLHYGWQVFDRQEWWWQMIEMQSNCEYQLRIKDERVEGQIQELQDQFALNLEDARVKHQELIMDKNETVLFLIFCSMSHWEYSRLFACVASATLLSCSHIPLRRKGIRPAGVEAAEETNRDRGEPCWAPEAHGGSIC